MSVHPPLCLSSDQLEVVDVIASLKLVYWLAVSQFVDRLTSLRLSPFWPIRTCLLSVHLSICRSNDQLEVVAVLCLPYHLSWGPSSQICRPSDQLEVVAILYLPYRRSWGPSSQLVDRVTNLRSSPFVTYPIVSLKGPALNLSTEWPAWGRRRSHLLYFLFWGSISQYIDRMAAISEFVVRATCFQRLRVAVLITPQHSTDWPCSACLLSNPLHNPSLSNGTFSNE